MKLNDMASCRKEAREARIRKKNEAEAELIRKAAATDIADLKQDIHYSLILHSQGWDKTLASYLCVKTKETHALLKDKKMADEMLSDLMYDKMRLMEITFSEPYALKLIGKKDKLNRAIRQLLPQKELFQREIPTLRDELRWHNAEERLLLEYEGRYPKIFDYFNDCIYRVTCERNELHFTLADYRQTVCDYLLNRMYFLAELEQYKKDYLNDISELEEYCIKRSLWAFKNIARLWKNINTIKSIIPHYINYHKERVSKRTEKLLERIPYEMFVNTKFRKRPLRSSKSELIAILNKIQRVEQGVMRKTSVIERIVNVLRIKSFGFNYDQVVDYIHIYFDKNFDLFYHLIHIRKEVSEIIQDLQDIKKLRLETQQELRRSEIADNETIAQLETDKRVMTYQRDKLNDKLEMYNRLPLIFCKYYKQLHELVGLPKQVHPFYKELVVFNLNARMKKKEAIKTELGDKIKEILLKEFPTYRKLYFKNKVNEIINKKYEKRLNDKARKRWKRKVVKFVRRKLNEKLGKEAKPKLFKRVLKKQIKKERSINLLNKIKDDVKSKFKQKLIKAIKPKLEKEVRKQYRKRINATIWANTKKPPMSINTLLSRLKDFFENYNCLLERAKHKARAARKLKRMQKRKAQKQKKRQMKKNKSITDNQRNKTPVAKKDKKPVAKNDKKPVAKKDKTPVAKNDKTPVAKNDKTPVAKNDKKPVAKKDKIPVAKNDKTPVAKNDKKPVAKKDKTPVAKNDKKTVPKKQIKRKSGTTLKSSKATTSYEDKRKPKPVLTRKRINSTKKKRKQIVKYGKKVKSKIARRNKRKFGLIVFTERTLRILEKRLNLKSESESETNLNKKSKKKDHIKIDEKKKDRPIKKDDHTEPSRLDGKKHVTFDDHHETHGKIKKKHGKYRRHKKHVIKKRRPKINLIKKQPPHEEIEKIVEQIIDIYVHGDEKIKDDYKIKESLMDPSTFKHYAAALESQIDMLLMKVYYKEHHEPISLRSFPVYIFRRKLFIPWQDKSKQSKLLEESFLEYSDPIYECHTPIKYPCFWCVHEALSEDCKNITINDVTQCIKKKILSKTIQGIWHDLEECQLPHVKEISEKVKRANQAYEEDKRAE